MTKTVYAILEADYSQVLAKEVQRHLDQGWSLQGGVSVMPSSKSVSWGVTYAQAITRTVLESGR